MDIILITSSTMLHCISSTQCLKQQLRSWLTRRHTQLIISLFRCCVHDHTYYLTERNDDGITDMTSLFNWCDANNEDAEFPKHEVSCYLIHTHEVFQDAQIPTTTHKMQRAPKHARTLLTIMKSISTKNTTFKSSQI